MDGLVDCVQLVFGNSGVLQGIGSGKAYIDMSTVDVETMDDVNEVYNSTLFVIKMIFFSFSIVLSMGTV